MTDASPAPTCPECGTRLPEGSPGDLCPSCLMRQALASRTLPDGAAPPPSAPPPSPAEIADKFPQFEITECLGRGGMGVVYKARQKSLDRWVAIKILAPGRVGEERFAREAQTLARLSHPNIVTVFDYGETDGLYFIVMEFVDGVNLRDLLHEGKLDPQQALAIVPPVCEALQYAHDKGIVHRDIKPENLLLDRDGRIKIADFGIAALVGAAGERSGTPPYMAPEQGEPAGGIDHRADIYALGAVLYETLTGERPGSPLQPPSQKVQVDIRIDDIVLRALSREPERRYRTADEFRTMVETIASTPERPAKFSAANPPPSPPPAAPVEETPNAGRVRIPAILMMILGGANIPSIVAVVILAPLYLLAHVGNAATADVPALPTWPLVTGVLFLATAVLGVTASVLALIGGRHMLRGSSRAWAITGAVACCFLPLLWPLGLALGITALVLLLRNKATVTPVGDSPTIRGTVPPATPGASPRLSGMALTGAVLEALFLGLVVLLLCSSVIFNLFDLSPHFSVSDIPPDGRELGSPAQVKSHLTFGIVMIPPILLLPIPGCILGWIAAARIRSSRGRLRGMGFAVFAAMTPVLLLTCALLLGTGAAAFHFLVALDPLQPDRATLLISAILIALTALFLLVLILGACLRHLKGTPSSFRRKAIRIVAAVLVALWLALGGLLWLQRPRLVDQGITSGSGDHPYAASASTWHRRRVFGDDLLSYRFVVQERSGRVFAEREIPVPAVLLAGDRRAAANWKGHFSQTGNIRWHEHAVEFCLGDLSVHSIGLPDGEAND